MTYSAKEYFDGNIMQTRVAALDCRRRQGGCAIVVPYALDCVGILLFSSIGRPLNEVLERTYCS